MDELKRLEREVNDLQNQLRWQNEQAERARQNLINENRRNLENYQKEMQRAIREHDAKAQAEYERLLREYQYSLSDEAGKKFAEMDADYNRLMNEVRRNEEALAQKNMELDRAVQELRSDIHRKEEGSGAQASEYLKNAVEQFRETEEKPHEKFMPKRLAIFYNSLKDGQQLFKAGLYEAATAVAISVKSGLERLGYNIDDKASEWDRQYDLLTLKTNYLRQRIRQELDDWKEYIGQPGDDSNSRKSRLIEINYWSRGEYAEVVRSSNRIHSVIASVEKDGRAAYLKKSDGATTDDLKKYIQEIDTLSERLSSLSVIYKERYTASCQRSEWGEQIIDFLTDEINLRWIAEISGFRQASGETLNAKDFHDYIQVQFGDEAVKEDAREWLKLVFDNSSGSTIYVYILPMEAKQQVENRIILHIDYGGAEQAQYSRDIYAHICEAIRIGEEAEETVNYTPDINELKVSTNKVYKETAADLEKAKRHSH